MVVLNEFLPICISSLKIHLSNKIREVLDDRLDHFIETSTIIKKTKKNIIFDNIIDDIKNIISSDNFLYLVMHDNYCIHKYKKGKKEGQYCAKIIRSNNPKKVYLCCQHDKDHIPKKKERKGIKKNVDIEGTIETKNINNKENTKKNKKKETIENIVIQKKGVSYINQDHDGNNLNCDSIKKKEKDTNVNIYSISDIDNYQKNMDKNVKFNENNKKYIKKKWRKLDILKDTGFTFD